VLKPIAVLSLRAQVLELHHVVYGEGKGEAEAAADADRRQVADLEMRVIEDAKRGIAGPDGGEFHVPRLQLDQFVDGGLVVLSSGQVRKVANVDAARKGG